MNQSTEADRPESSAPKAKSRRGFAGMTLERVREIASSGGKKAHAIGTAHHFTSEEGRSAGQKGGRLLSQNREYMRALGRKGGLKRAENILSRARSLPN